MYNKVYLVVQSSYLLLTGCREQEGVHLGLQRIIHLHVDVVARSLLLIVGVHAVNKTTPLLKPLDLCYGGEALNSCTALLQLPDHMVDDDGVRWHQEGV